MIRILVCALLLVSAGASAQLSTASEVQQLRDAATRETAGDLTGAETLLRAALTRNPQSLPALLSLERVLKLQARLAELVPAVHAFLGREPESAIARQMLLRTYSALDRVDELRDAADAWIRRAPRIEPPYRETARIWEARGDFARAVQYLEMGRSRIGREDALALELGDIYAALDEYARAAREWERAVGPEARGFMLVQRRLATMRDGGAQMLPRLVDALLREPTSTARKRAATQLAIDAGMRERAEQIARLTYTALTPHEQPQFLIEIARRADGAQLASVAYFAYAELLRLGAGEPLPLRTRMAELALAMGDTARAAEVYRTLENAYAPGSPERRQAAGLRIQLTAREGKIGEADAELDSFRRDYPDAPELDAVAAAVATGWIERSDLDRAELALRGAAGPRSNLTRSRIALRRGDVTKAKAALLAAAPGLQGAEATEAIRMASTFGRLSRDGGELIARALTRSTSGAPGEAVGLLLTTAAGLPGSEPATILELAASIADRNQMEPAAEKARRAIIEGYPSAPERPAALLALARSLSNRNESVLEARDQLERLILEHPHSPLLPQARHELDKLQGRIPRS